MPKAKPENATQERISELREQVEKLQSSVAEFLEAGLSRRALVVLLHAHTRIKSAAIEKLIDGLEDFDQFLFSETDALTTELDSIVIPLAEPRL